MGCARLPGVAGWRAHQQRGAASAGLAPALPSTDPQGDNTFKRRCVHVAARCRCAGTCLELHEALCLQLQLGHAAPQLLKLLGCRPQLLVLGLQRLQLLAAPGQVLVRFGCQCLRQGA